MKTDDPFYEKLFLLALSETLRRDGVARAWVNARRIADAFYREHLNEGPSAGLLGDPEGPQ